MTVTNRVRAYHYLAGVLINQQQDLFCGRCSAWNNTLSNLRESLAQFEQSNVIELNALSPAAAELLIGARSLLEELKNIPEPTGQKKAGNCAMPEGICFVKYSKAILEKI